jgi:class 3 adenylate cyclase
VVISDSVYKHVPDDVRVKRKFRIKLKGVKEESTLYGIGSR